MKLVIQIVAVFSATVLLDILWAQYILHTSKSKALQASLYASVLYVLGGFTVMNYVSNHWLLIPASVGAFVGTYLALWWENRNDRSMGTTDR
jgi:hypothetical protein